jgi:hypothetical protein
LIGEIVTSNSLTASCRFGIVTGLEGFGIFTGTQMLTSRSYPGPANIGLFDEVKTTFCDRALSQYLLKDTNQGFSHVGLFFSYLFC